MDKYKQHYVGEVMVDVVYVVDDDLIGVDVNVTMVQVLLVEEEEEVQTRKELKIVFDPSYLKNKYMEQVELMLVVYLLGLDVLMVVVVIEMLNEQVMMIVVVVVVVVSDVVRNVVVEELNVVEIIVVEVVINMEYVKNFDSIHLLLVMNLRNLMSLY